MMNTLDHMTKSGCWRLTLLYTFAGHDECPWPYDQIRLLTADQAIMYTFDLPGPDEYPWPYDQIGQLTTTHSTGLVMMDHIGLLTTALDQKLWLLTTDQAIDNVLPWSWWIPMTIWPNWDVDHWPNFTHLLVMLSALVHMIKLDCWPLTKQAIMYTFNWPGSDEYP